MQDKDLLWCLQDVEWFFKHIDQWAVNPSKYRKSHQNTLRQNAHVTYTALKAVMEEIKQRQEGGQEKA